MDKYRIDSHKLLYHVSRVNDWLEGKNVYPIYAEISPAGTCNHRCTYCALDFMEYQPRFLDKEMLKERLSERLMFMVADELLKSSKITDEMALKWGSELKRGAAKRSSESFK